jgi:NitT/TauT family transport system substrate-binding protein
MTIFLSVLLILGFSSAAHGRTIRVAIPGQAYVIASFAAKDQGYYEQENLNVELVQMPVGIGVQALLGGNVEFAAMGSALFSAILGSAPLRIIMSSFNRPLFFLYSKPALTGLPELKGKKVGVPALGTSGHSMLVELLRRQGHAPEHDVAILGFGDTETRLQALLSGVLDAAVLSPPASFVAEESGFRQLLSFINQDLVFPGGGIGVSEKLLQSDPALVERFTRATLKGHEYVRSVVPGTIPIISRRLRMKKTHAEKYYDLMRKALTSDGTMDAAAQKKALDPAVRLRGTSGTPILQKIFDFSLLHKINADLKAARWKP